MYMYTPKERSQCVLAENQKIILSELIGACNKIKKGVFTCKKLLLELNIL